MHEYYADLAMKTSVVWANRGIAQSGSAPALGAGCREFESLYPDQFVGLIAGLLVSFSLMVVVAQLVESRTVTPVVVGSSPIGHPIFLASLVSAIRCARSSIG